MRNFTRTLLFPVFIVVAFCFASTGFGQVPGNALAFDGSGDYVTVTNNTAFSFGTGDFTIEAWVKTSSGGTIVGRTVQDINGQTGGYALGISGGQVFFKIGAVSVAPYFISHAQIPALGNIFGDPYPVSDGRWHHIAGVRRGGTAYIYIDGESSLGTGALVNANITSALGIGVSRDLFTYTTPNIEILQSYLSGSMDELRIYNAGLTDAQIQADMINTAPALPGNLQLYYNFNQGVAGGSNSGSTVTDQSGNNRTGTMTGFALSGTTSNWVSSYAMAVPVSTGATGAIGIVGIAGFTANWTPPVNGGPVSNYVIDIREVRKLSANSYSSRVFPGAVTVAGTANSHTFTNLVPSTSASFTTTYYYYVRAVSSLGSGGNSNWMSLTMPVTQTPSISAGPVTGTIVSCAGFASASPNLKQFNVSGNNLANNIVATAPAGFEISLQPGTGYGNTVTLVQTAHAVAATTIYVRSSAAAPAGNIAGNVVLTSQSANTVNVGVSGTVNLVSAIANHAGAGCENDQIELYVDPPGASYVWTGPNGFSSTQQNPVIPNGILANAGLYTVTVTDAGGCVGSASTTVTVGTNPVITAGSNSPVCEGGTLNLNAGGGVSYIWNGPNGFNSTTQNPTVTNLPAAAAGTYVVKGTGANGCRSDASVTVALAPQPVVTPITTGNSNGFALCIGSAAVFNNATPAGVWSSSNPSVALVDATGKVTAVGAGSVSVNYTVTNATNCSTTVSQIVTVNARPPAIAYNVIDDCKGVDTVRAVNLVPGNTILWSTGATTNPIVVASAGTYSATQTDPNGCSSPFSATPVNTPRPTPATPVIAVTNNCDQTSLITASGFTGNLQWSIPAGNVPSITVNAAGVYGVRQIVNGCPSAIASITAAPKTTPTATISADGATSVCPGIGVSLHANTGAGYTYQWLKDGNPVGGGTNADYAAIATGSYSVLITSDGCVSAPSNSIAVTVEDVIAPTFTTPLIVLNANMDGSVTATSANGAAVFFSLPAAVDNCTANPTVVATPASGSVLPIGASTVVVTATDAAGNTSTANYTVVVVGVAPAISCPSNIVVDNDPGKCGAIVNFTATETLGIPASTITYSVAPGTFFGTRTHTVTATASNAVGTSSCTFTITVLDKEVPVPVIATLPAISGECSVTATAPTATDNCAGTITATTADPLTYTVQGNYVIHWVYDDGNGNTSTQTQTVIVKDITAPVADNEALPAVTGECTAVVTSVPTATDNCMGAIIGVTNDPLTYNTQGTYTITWTYDDGNGNTSTQTQTVIVKDVTAPEVPTLAAVTGECSANALIPTATDNCAGIVYGTTTDPLTYTAQGTYTIHWTFDDGNGNTSTATQTVIVKDVTAPEVPTLATVTGECSANAAIPKASDNCAGTVYGTTTDPLTYTTQGTYTIHWTFDDGNGNTSTAAQTIIVKDVTAPVVSVSILPTITSECSATVTAPAATDNCAGTITGTTVDPLTYNTPGTYTIHWTFADGNGNTSTQTQTVVVKDVTAPVPNVASLPIIRGECSVTVPRPTATDNCAGTIIGTTTDPLTYASQGTYTIRWTYNDGHGNSSAQNQTVIVEDITSPTISTLPNVTVGCNGSTDPDATGRATATDNCGTPVVTYADVQVGNTITRTWKATDAAGNYLTSTQTITIGAGFGVTVTSVPTNSTFTGGIPTNLYLGYGAQSTTLMLSSLPSAGAPYTYKWTGTAASMLSTTTGSSPVFTPTSFGYYAFTVTVTNKYGCTGTASISICVTDIRVAGSNGKVYVCHAPPGDPANRQTLSISVNAVAAHLSEHSGDRLGTCGQSPCNTAAANSIVGTTITKSTAESASAITTEKDELKVTAMPNPSATFFTLRLESKYETPVTMRVMDGRGRVVDARSGIGANSTLQIGHHYSSGTYYAELMQNNTRKVVQLIKVK